MDTNSVTDEGFASLDTVGEGGEMECVLDPVVGVVAVMASLTGVFCVCVAGDTMTAAEVLFGAVLDKMKSGFGFDMDVVIDGVETQLVIGKAGKNGEFQVTVHADGMREFVSCRRGRDAFIAHLKEVITTHRWFKTVLYSSQEYEQQVALFNVIQSWRGERTEEDRCCICRDPSFGNRTRCNHPLCCTCRHRLFVDHRQDSKCPMCRGLIVDVDEDDL